MTVTQLLTFHRENSIFFLKLMPKSGWGVMFFERATLQDSNELWKEIKIHHIATASIAQCRLLTISPDLADRLILSTSDTLTDETTERQSLVSFLLIVIIRILRIIGDEEFFARSYVTYGPYFSAPTAMAVLERGVWNARVVDPRNLQENTTSAKRKTGRGPLEVVGRPYVDSRTIGM